jgi:hypothetical protein
LVLEVLLRLIQQREIMVVILFFLLLLLQLVVVVAEHTRFLKEAQMTAITVVRVVAVESMVELV